MQNILIAKNNKTRLGMMLLMFFEHPTNDIKEYNIEVMSCVYLIYATQETH